MATFYRVGGCIRDRLLNLPIKDEDWVVTGSTPDEMQAQGFQPIGKDFPVFLHPESKQEYALARTERKTAPGYHGFVFHAADDVSIEQDLARRDLTINAIAEREDGELIDPFNGQQDIEARLLRHVSPAFVEDPVRVLRVARFAARFHHLGFQLAEETRELIGEMGLSGELDALVAERVWQELDSALGERDPQIFFELLRECRVLDKLFPEIDDLFGVPQTAKFHPEVDTGVHVMMVLKKSAELAFDKPVRFAALMHDLGKAITPVDILPGHRGHEQRGLKRVKAFCQRWRVPKAYAELATLTCEYHTHVHRAFELKASTLLKLFRKTDSFRRPERFRQMIEACLADVRGRLNFEDCDYPQGEYLLELTDRLNRLDLSEVTSAYQGKELAKQIEQKRVRKLKGWQEELKPVYAARLTDY